MVSGCMGSRGCTRGGALGPTQSRPLLATAPLPPRPRAARPKLAIDLMTKADKQFKKDKFPRKVFLLSTFSQVLDG